MKNENQIQNKSTICQNYKICGKGKRAFTNNSERDHKSPTKTMNTSGKAKEKPWLDEKGEIKSDKLIEIEGKSWSARTWNNYLDFSIKSLRDDKMILVEDVQLVQNHAVKSSLLKKAETANYHNLGNFIGLALTYLSPREKLIIQLYYYEKKATSDISQILAITPNTIKTHKFRALKKLKKLLSSSEFKKVFLSMKA